MTTPTPDPLCCEPAPKERYKWAVPCQQISPLATASRPKTTASHSQAEQQESSRAVLIKVAAVN